MVRPKISYSQPRYPVRRWPPGSGLIARAVAAIKTRGRAYSQAGTSAHPGRSPVGQSAKSPVSVMNAASQNSTPKRQMKSVSTRTTLQAAIKQTIPQVAGNDLSARMGDLPNACVSDRRQRKSDSRAKPSVEAASCSLDAMVGHLWCQRSGEHRKAAVAIAQPARASPRCVVTMNGLPKNRKAQKRTVGMPSQSRGPRSAPTLCRTYTRSGVYATIQTCDTRRARR
jgi:hypothetical protein